MADPSFDTEDMMAYRKRKAGKRRQLRRREARDYEPRPYKPADAAFARRLEVGFRMLGRAV